MHEKSFSVNQKGVSMRQLKWTGLCLSLCLALPFSALAKKECTKEPKDKWMKQEDLEKRLIAEGYKIKKFKQPGTCYEIYGTNKEGKKVEIYFDPVTGQPVK